MSEIKKQQFNVRVSPETVSLVERAAYVFGKTRAQVVEQSIEEYAQNHHISERYQLNIKNGMLVLLKLNGDVAEIVEMETLNGISPEKIAERYSARFHQKVTLRIEKQEKDQ